MIDLDGDWLPELSKDPLGTLVRMGEEHGDVVRFTLGDQRTILVSHPEHAQQVLTRPKTFIKGGRWSVMKPMLGEGLLMSNGERWLRDRRMIGPSLSRHQMARLVASMVQTTREEVDALVLAAREEQDVDLSAAMTRLTLKVVVRALFGDAIDAHIEAVDQAFARANSWLARRIWATDEENPARRARFDTAIQDLDDVVLGLIEARRASGERRDDLLDVLLHAKDADGVGLSSQELRDHAITLLLAGHETTANALTWSWYLLGQRPEMIDRLADEARAHGCIEGPDLTQSRQLDFAGRVFRESMRLYPPIWLLPRLATEPTHFDGVDVDSGDVLLVCPFILHRKAGLWDAPDQFDPDRFGPAADLAHPFAYIPFGGGARTCVGRHFSLLEGRVILAMLAARLEILPLHDGELKPLPLLTLRPRHRVRVRLRERL
ncbi:MAG: cytochrome P450 [Proteobacteria bacterium]|nr:cytochrome P450 [Pseudomonadota bacterium]